MPMSRDPNRDLPAKKSMTAAAFVQMSLPSLSPLRARFTVSLAATLLIPLVSFAAFSPRLAYAADIGPIGDQDRNHPIPLDVNEWSREDAVVPLIMDADEETPVSDDSVAGQAPTSPDAELYPDEPKKKNIEIGETQNWVLKTGNLAGPKPRTPPDLPPSERMSDNTTNKADDVPRNTLSARSTAVYITANTCQQPLLNATQVSTDTGPAQLRLYISQSESVTTPGPNNTDDQDVTVVDFEGGYVSFELQVDQEAYIGIEAPNSTRYGGIYNYEIAASTQYPYHSIETSNPFLFFVDSDTGAALLQTNDTTEADTSSEDYKRWMSMDPLPFTMFAHSMNDTSILGLEQSYCGLSTNAQIRKESGNVKGGMTARGVSQKPKQQFYIKGLNESASYYGFLAIEPNSTDLAKRDGTGGAKLWRQMNFTTKAESNCAVISDLEFCSEVAYAVPSHPSFTVEDLKSIYDTYAQDLYKNFSRSLQQIPCDAGDSSQYSLARTCADCDTAYKQWLCTVTIPRCQDFSSTLPYLQTRNLGQPFVNGTALPDDYPGRQEVVSNSSRNPLIDKEIQPGPYKEVLPCKEVCYELVKSCPSALGFGCPRKEWLYASYGTNSTNGDMTCSYLGAAYFMNGANRIVGDERMNGFIILGLVTFWSLVWIL